MSGSSAENGHARPRLPTGVVVASVVVALVSVSGLLLLLYRETRGPGEILRRFATAVDDGDCGGSYDLLDGSVQATMGESEWCQRLPLVDGQIDADFGLDQAVLQGDRAELHLSGPAEPVWLLHRYGQRSWRVLGPEGGFAAR
jgi:hypothetical protein